MKPIITIIFASIALFGTSCKQTPKPKACMCIDTATLTKEVTESEAKLFQLTKEGKMAEAFSIHKNSPTYRNIVDGISRNYSQMDSVIKNLAVKKVKALQYDIAAREFLIIDNSDVLETVDANRKMISVTDSIIENRPVMLSILWAKDSTKWNVAYIHSSYKF